MPIVLIVVGLAVAVGLGSYFFRPDETANQESDLVIEVPAEETPIEMPVEVPADEVIEAPETTSTPTSPTPATTPSPVVTPAPAPVPATTYQNGTFSATAPYTAPGNAKHNVAVSLTLSGDIVTGATVSYSGDKVDTSTYYQNRFSNVYQAQVIGKKLDSISLSRVGGASLTSNAFNNAVNQIKASAKN